MKHLFFIFILFSNYSFGQKSNVFIKGNISGIGDDTVYVWRYLISDVDNTIKDTIFAKNNKFTYKIYLKEPAAMAIIPNKSYIYRMSGRKYMPQGRFIELFVYPKDSFQVRGSLEPYYLSYLVKGSPINEDYSIKRKAYKAPEIEVAKVELHMDSLSTSPETKEEIKELFKERIKKQNEVATIKVNYVLKNLGNDISAYYLSTLSLNTFARYYPKLTERVRAGFFKNVLDNKYDRYLKFSAAKKAEKKLVKNSIAPDFRLKSINGKQYELSDFKGKLIVLDFWGTWCGPCMAEIPKLKSIYDSLKTKVAFIGIACNDTKEAIQKTVKMQQIDWLQLINTNENDVSVLYGVQAYPTKFILNENLKIVRRFVGMEEEFYEFLRELVN